MLRRKGADVRDVRSVLTEHVDWSVGDRIALENLAFNCLQYEYRTSDDVDGQAGELCLPDSKPKEDEAEEFYVSDVYKRQVIEEMGTQQLVDIIFTNPTVTVSPSPRDTGFVASYKFDPLSNIIFVRDQQITTRKGIVMARLRSPQRQREVDILEFCFKKLGLDVIGRVALPGHLEGGDFFPAGEKLAFIGIGPRSDWNAVKYLLEEDLIGTEIVAVVKDEYEKKQDRMHLDTVFNIISSKCCLMLDEMMGSESPTKRLVDEYTLFRPGENEAEESTLRVGKYVQRRKDIEFSKYVEEQGYNIIPVSGDEQLNYGCNVLNLGDGNIISIQKTTARKIACSPHFNGTVEFLDFSAVTSMYGGVHCASQVVVRGRGDNVLAASSEKPPHSNGVVATTFTDDKPNGNGD